jgi:hypothetical protein
MWLHFGHRFVYWRVNGNRDRPVLMRDYQHHNISSMNEQNSDIGRELFGLITLTFQSPSTASLDLLSLCHDHSFQSLEKCTMLALPKVSFYSPLTSRSSISEDIEDKADLLQNNTPNLQLVRKSRKPWIISTVFFATTTVFLLVNKLLPRSGTFETGFDTDLASVRSAIELQKVTFTGSPSFAADGTEYVKPQPDLKQYVGPPNAAIDKNWNELTANRYFLLTAAEAEEAWGPSYVNFWDEQHGGYSAGLDMFHTLHCLDHLRQAFYPEHYPQTPIHGTMHRDHCIDHLRQMIMCSADTTPIPSRFYKGISQNYIDSDQKHTCRNFKAIRAWTTERFFASRLVSEHHQSK